MSEPQISDPVDQPASPGEVSEDPLLGSESFIDQEKAEPNSTPDVGSGPEVAAIAAEPISMLRPGEDSVEAAPRSAARRRDPEEMAKRPSWLPEDWKIDLRVRSSGATAGLIDRYFIGPSGQRRFRSKNEVLHFLETGSNKKRKSTSEADAEPSESPVSSPTPKKSAKKGKKSKGVSKSPASSSKKSRKKGKKAEDVSKESEDVSKESEDVSKESEDIPKVSEDLPEKGEDVPQESDDVSEKCEDVSNGDDEETDK